MPDTVNYIIEMQARIKEVLKSIDYDDINLKSFAEFCNAFDVLEKEIQQTNANQGVPVKFLITTEEKNCIRKDVLFPENVIDDFAVFYQEVPEAPAILRVFQSGSSEDLGLDWSKAAEVVCKNRGFA